jgi:hypothetical protein
MDSFSRPTTVETHKEMNTREPKDQEDFNYKYIKVLLKTANKDYPTGIREILLPRNWI